MFGFTHLASFGYFSHVQRALEARFRNAGLAVEMQVSDVLPTASVRRRALRLAELVERTATGDGPIHLLGHSTGVLDARLVASPGAQLSKSAATAHWLPRLRSVTTMNTPHYGTPLASFFATAKGQQALYALSAFTVVGLSPGQHAEHVRRAIRLPPGGGQPFTRFHLFGDGNDLLAGENAEQAYQCDQARRG